MLPGVAAHLHAGVDDPLRAGRVGGNLVADQKERRLRVVVVENLQQPVGVGAGTVVEREGHALDLRAVDVGGARQLHMAGQTPRTPSTATAPAAAHRVSQYGLALLTGRLGT